LLSFNGGYEQPRREHGDARLRQKINTRFLRTAAVPGLHAVANTQPNPPVAPIEFAGATTRFCANAEIYGEGEPAESLYQVVSGTIRTSRILADGRRQIGGFYLPGEIFGLEPADAHSHSAEATVDSRVVVIRRTTMLSLAACNRHVALQLWALTWHELARAQAHVRFLVQSAHERVAGFLLDMASRFPEDHAIELQMPRQDIADFLGLTIETVSRTLTHLEREGMIALPNTRRIVLCNRPALSRMKA
jgi:CRP-like cAMP-binding protein